MAVSVNTALLAINLVKLSVHFPLLGLGKDRTKVFVYIVFDHQNQMRVSSAEEVCREEH